MVPGGGAWRKSALLTLVMALFTLEGAALAERPEEVASGCHRKGHKVTCRAWRGPDAPDIPPSSSWTDFWVLDLSAMDAAKRVDMAVRGATCNVQNETWEWRGLGATLAEGRLPARWLGTRYRGIIVLYMRGLGLRSVHRDAFELLTAVQHVYLSSNRLRRLEPDMWKHNERLTGVSLENNLGLELPEDAPIFSSDNVEYLDLSGCGLRTVPAAAFEALPRLQTLRLERNCLRAVPAQALAPITDLWSAALGENVITGLTAEEAALLARLPDGHFHGNPWRCDCALRQTLQALDEDERGYWDGAMADLVCLWPPEDIELSWQVVLKRDTCREYNETLDNATNLDVFSSASTQIPKAGDGGAGAEAAAATATHCAPGCGAGGDATFCRWTAAGTLVLLVLGLVAFVLAAFSGRVAVTISVAGRGALRKRGTSRANSSLSRTNLTESAQENGEFLPDDAEEGRRRDGGDPWYVVRFGRGT